MSLHNQRSYLTLGEIIEAIDGPYNDGTWCGKNYSVGALVQDLKDIRAAYEAKGIVDPFDLPPRKAS